MTPIELAEMVEKWGNQLESKDIQEVAKTLRLLYEENLFFKEKAKEIFDFYMDKE